MQVLEDPVLTEIQLDVKLLDSHNILDRDTGFTGEEPAKSLIRVPINRRSFGGRRIADHDNGGDG